MENETTTPTSDNKNNMMAWVIGLIIVIIIIVLVVLVLRARNQQISNQQVENPIVTPTEIVEEATEGAQIATESAVLTSDQTVGSSVTITSATFAKPGYVVIHQQKGAEVESVIGQSKLYQAGTYANVKVTLTRPSIAGETLYTMLHDDDGDGTYEFPGPDAPTQNKAGQVVITSFKVK